MMALRKALSFRRIDCVAIEESAAVYPPLAEVSQRDGGGYSNI
jgi:hypothetical protein